MLDTLQMDLRGIATVLEGIVAKLPEMRLQDQIDVTARIAGIANHCQTIEKWMRVNIVLPKAGPNGVVIGEDFKASTSTFPVNRLDLDKLKKERPKTYRAYVETRMETRVFYRVR
jgi:hypothetical protein